MGARLALVLRARAGHKPRVTIGRGLLYGYSLALFGLSAVWLFGVFLSPWAWIVALLSYVALIVWGVMTPRLQMFGPALCAVPGASGKLALTFDDGPDPTSTPRVLDELKRVEARATFFMVGQKVAKHPELVARVVREGHELGAHSYDHNRMYAFLSADEVHADIQRTCAAISRAAGVAPTWFRPPVGQMSPPTAAGILRSGLRVAGWSVRSLDGLPSTTSEQVIRRVLPRLRSGAIVLLHDAPEKEQPGGKPPAGVDALPEVLVACRERGLACVPLGELVSEETRPVVRPPA